MKYTDITVVYPVHFTIEEAIENNPEAINISTLEKIKAKKKVSSIELYELQKQLKEFADYLFQTTTVESFIDSCDIRELIE